MRKIVPMVCLEFLLFVGLARAEGDAGQLSQAIRENPRVETVVPLLPRIGALLRDDDAKAAALPLAEQAAEILAPTAAAQGNWPATSSLLKSAARMRYELSEPEKAAKHLQSLRELYRALGEPLPPGNADSQRARWTFEIVLEYLRGEQIGPALELLGEAVDRSPQTPEFDEFRSAVAGALHRRLEQMRTDQRYETLYAWTMPAGDRRSVRVMSSLASVEAPPDVFARALGERPRANAFSVPAIGGVDGLFSTAWLLVRAAAESGRLRRLTTELEELAGANVAHADKVLLLAQIADRNTGADVLRSRIDSLLKPGEQSPGLLDGAVIGAACLEREDLQSTALGVFETLFDQFGPAAVEYGRSFLRRARATAIIKRHEGADATLLADPGLKFWIPASEERAVRSAAGVVRETWLCHEDHIMHLAGPPNDYLCFRYPLAGDFEFQVETQFGGREAIAGGAAFGGIAYLLGGATTADELRVAMLDIRPIASRPFPFFRKEQWSTYQRLVLRTTAHGTELVINGHPVWTDSLPTSTSPWLALRCFGNHIPAFRNLQLSGDPSIPREVRASDGNVLRGWFSQFYPSRIPHALLPDGSEVPTDPNLTEIDWSLRDGVIYGAQRDGLLSAAIPSRLTYFRPLQNDESVSYEFLYEPGRNEIHPALGRLALLVEPNGIRVHWMTGGEAESTGLPEDNATIEPLNRRGPRPLPLNSGRWNRMTMSLGNDALTLTLNDVEIYSRKMETENSRRFSLFYDRSRSAAQVRNVVLRGDWPERLTAEEKTDLLMPRERAGR